MTGDELLAFAFGAGIERTRDESGRALGEHVAGRLSDEDLARLRFLDPRDASDLPANIAALAGVRRSWAQVLQVLAPDQPGTFVGMLDATRTATAMVTSRVLAGHAIPEALGAAYKVSIGFGSLLRAWALIEGPREPPSVHGLLATLDSGAWLVGETHVCPGSRAAIAEVWGVLQGDHASDAGSSGEVARARELRRALSYLEGMLLALHIAARTNPKVGDSLDRYCRGDGRLNVALNVADHVIGVSAERAGALVLGGLPSAFARALRGGRDGLVPAFTNCASQALGCVLPGAEVTPAALDALRIREASPGA